MSMNKILSCLIALLAVAACMKDDAYIVSSTAELTFSTDTVALDTVIAGQGSNTYTFEVYNKQNKAIRITRVWLENGAASDFKVNVDGSALTSGETNDLEIAAKDSMRVFLFVKTKDLNADTPQRTSDKLYFQTEGGFIGVVILNAFGQSVTTFKGKVIERDTILSSRRPYQIYDSLVIAKDATLSVSPGVRFYFHPGAQLIVHGKLLARGTLSSPIIMRGDRLGNMFSQQAYDNIPGQWGGVVFTQESFNNEMDYVDIHSGNFGIRCDSSAVSQLKLKLTNSIVHNTKGDGIFAKVCNLKINNCQLTNAGGNCLTLLGGSYDFVHCTIGNFYMFAGGRGVALSFTNAEGDVCLPLERLDFINCILTGYGADEILGSKSKRYDNDPFNFSFRNCLIDMPKPVEQEDLAHFINCFWDNSKDGKVSREDNFSPKFDLKKLTFSFQLDSLSQAVGNADIEQARLLSPVDRLGRSRLHGRGADIGCYQRQ